MAGEWEQRVAPDDETVGEGQRLDAESLPAFFERVTRLALARAAWTRRTCWLPRETRDAR